MDGKLTYGPFGRLISGIAGFAGIFAAFVASAQAANLFSLFPPKYTPIVVAIPIVSLFFTLFSERLQGGASNPEVRKAAEKSDQKNAIQEMNQSGSK
jgi:hypothetical protein